VRAKRNGLPISLARYFRFVDQLLLGKATKNVNATTGGNYSAYLLSIPDLCAVIVADEPFEYCLEQHDDLISTPSNAEFSAEAQASIRVAFC